MKKTGFILILLCLCISLISCINSEPTVSDVSSEVTTKPTVIVEPKYRYEFSYDEYVEYINEHKAQMPDNFVYYEGISIIGEFKSFNVPFNDFEWYDYELTDRTGTKIWLNVDRDLTNDRYRLAERVKQVDSSDMRDIEPVAKGVHQYDHFGIRYGYRSDGVLETIMFDIDGLAFNITGVHRYPNDSITIIGKLLNLDTALDALAEIKRCVRGKDVFNVFDAENVYEHLVYGKTTYAEVKGMIGIDGTDIGSGTIIYEWNVEGGEALRIRFKKPEGVDFMVPDDLIVVTGDIYHPQTDQTA